MTEKVTVDREAVVADICIVAEGSYPYNHGGVAEWVHQLIQEHKERTFHILTLMPPNPDLTMAYTFPDNVIGHTVFIVQMLPEGANENKTPPELWNVVAPTLQKMMSSRNFSDYLPMLSMLGTNRDILGKKILTESMDAWKFSLRMYEEIMPDGPFKSFFATVYTLGRSLYSIALPHLPPALLYHSVCTGYAGFLLYRAREELGAACILTEHGIYTNERRIEIAMSDWIVEMGSLDLALEDKKKTLKDFWINAFFSMSHTCYISCDEVLTTYDGNQEIQISGGADPAKVRTIVHGIKLSETPPPPRSLRKRTPTVAFIGRVVPIKDVKTFIRACRIVKDKMPDVRLLALGSVEEEEDYVAECQLLIDSLGLADDLKLSGQVNLKKYLPDIDLMVLTSISEAQPLTILEMAAHGIPAVATNVGACDQLLYGAVWETPPLGQGGIVTPLVNPAATADAIIKILSDHAFYEKCSEVMIKRIHTYYVFEKEHEEYRAIYKKYLGD